MKAPAGDALPMPSPSLWTHARAALDPYTRRWTDQYLAYPLTREEYVATVDWKFRDLRLYLYREGYTPQRLSAAKRHPETEELHVLSMRKVPDRHPPWNEHDFTYLADITLDYDPSDCQYHVHAFPSATGTGLDVYSHYELRPLRHPIEHYRPTYGETYLRGVTDVDW